MINRPTTRTPAVGAAATIVAVLIGAGLAACGDTADTATSPSTVPPVATTTVPPVATTTAPTTSLPPVDASWSGGLLDDLDTTPLRPLDAYIDGDVIIPTAPTGWRVDDSGWTGGAVESADWRVSVTEAAPDDQFGLVVYVRMSREPACGFQCVPWGEPVTVNGVVWESLVVEGAGEESDEFLANMNVRAAVADQWVFAQASSFQLLTGPLLEDPTILEFLGGLRVGPESELTAIGEACWGCGSSGAEGDPFAAADPSNPAPPTTPDDELVETPVPPELVPGGLGSATGRPLTELSEGDVVVPTYIPPGLTLQSDAQIYDRPNLSEFSLTLETADGQWANSVRLWQNGGPIGPARSGDPNHPYVEIAGLTWEWNDFERARIAHVGSFAVWVYLDGLDRSEAKRFIEGLRAVPAEEFPGTVVVDGTGGLTVINGAADAELVASDQRFELRALGSGERVCMKLEDTNVPASMFFAVNCYEPQMMDESGVVDFHPLDETDTDHLIIGVIDSPSATAVRIISPEGESVFTPTGPANSAIDGRFFLARLELDVSNGIDLGQITIEDAST